MKHNHVSTNHVFIYSCLIEVCVPYAVLFNYAVSQPGPDTIILRSLHEVSLSGIVISILTKYFIWRKKRIPLSQRLILQLTSYLSSIFNPTSIVVIWRSMRASGRWKGGNVQRWTRSRCNPYVSRATKDRKGPCLGERRTSGSFVDGVLQQREVGAVA